MVTSQQDIAAAAPTSRAPGTLMGFALPVEVEDVRPPIVPPDSAFGTQVADVDTEETLAKRIRQMALVNVEELSKQLAWTGVQPETSLTAKMNILDQQIKLSGVASRNQAKESSGAAFSITINIPGQPSQTIGNVIDVTPSDASGSDE